MIGTLLVIGGLIGVYRLMLGGGYVRRRGRRSRGLMPSFNPRRASLRVGSITGDNMALLLATASVVTAAFDGAGRLAAIPTISPSTGTAIAGIVALLIVLSVLNARLAAVTAGVIGLVAAIVGTLADHGPEGVLALLVILALAFVLLGLCRGLFGRG